MSPFWDSPIRRPVTCFVIQFSKIAVGGCQSFGCHPNVTAIRMPNTKHNNINGLRFATRADLCQTRILCGFCTNILHSPMAHIEMVLCLFLYKHDVFEPQTITSKNQKAKLCIGFSLKFLVVSSCDICAKRDVVGGGGFVCLVSLSRKVLYLIGGRGKILCKRLGLQIVTHGAWFG